MPINVSTLNTLTHGWTIKTIRGVRQVKFGKRPCWYYQVQTVLAIYEEKDIVGCAPTGAGKFWM
jgi:superfamily II DNA/RNA helicase